MSARKRASVREVVTAGADVSAGGDAGASVPVILKGEHKIVAIDSVKPHPGNPRQGDVGAISVSIEENGFYGECLVQKSTSFIIAGSHRWRAAKAKAMPQVPINVIDVDDDVAMRIMLADNKTNDLASYDDHKLADLLTRLASTGRALAGTGYSGDDLDDLVQKLAVPGLDELARMVGDPIDGALWPVLRLKLPPELFERFTVALKSMPGADDAERLSAMLDRVDSVTA